MEITWRPAVRVICLDARSRVLMLCWRDPSDGTILWEPPGGGIDPGETAFQAACRELVEETGFDPAAIMPQSLEVPRDTVWNGRRFVGTEPFFLARYAADAPAPSTAGLLWDERHNLQQYAWFSPTDLGQLIDRLEPPELAAVIAALDPNGPWAA